MARRVFSVKSPFFRRFTLFACLCVFHFVHVNGANLLPTQIPVSEFQNTAKSRVVKCLYVWDKSGGRVSFPLGERPKIIYDLDHSLIHCETTKQKVDFSLKEVHKYTIETVNDSQTGIDEVTEEIKENGKISRKANNILFEKFTSGTQIRVFSINGRLLQSYQVDGEGRLSISTQNWESGVYLIYTGSATYKIIIK